VAARRLYIRWTGKVKKKKKRRIILFIYSIIQVVTLYVNGVEVASSPPGKFSGNVRYPEEQFASLYGEVFAIGAKHDGNEYQPMIGEVDEVVLWDQYLGPEDIQKLAAAAEVPTELPPPLHWYRFNEVRQTKRRKK